MFAARRVGAPLVVGLALVACSAGSVAPLDSVDSMPPTDAVVERRALGMNDVTMLVPLPTDLAAPVLFAIDGVDTQLVWHFHVDAVLGNDIGPKNDAPMSYYDFHVVAARVDLCDRDQALGPCPDGADGRLRLVFQPIYRTSGGEIFAHDVGLHAFYPIPAADLPGVVTELRALARMQDAPLDGPLAVSPALAAGDVAYTDRLRALVGRYARWDKLVRLTALGQDLRSVAFEWVLRGGEIVDGRFVLTPIATLGGANRQIARLGGGDTIFVVDPVADAPAGFATAINGVSFAEADGATRRAALDALVAVENPDRHGLSNTQCLGCHVTTFLTVSRARALGLDLASMPGRYTSRYNVAVDSVAGTDARVVRGLGWAARFPAISQRVANDTAQVLGELEQRFPPPP